MEENLTKGDCAAMRMVADRIGDRWSLIVMAALAHGPIRFNPLLHALGDISKRMLTFTLRKLERDGLIVRRPVIAAHVEYALSPLGRSLNEVAQGLLDWAVERGAELEEARINYDARATDKL